ncbi:hypothetical protein O9929_03065 [Vibrio lentus]|nr:hypothetical protein [Vibrio lentus]
MIAPAEVDAFIEENKALPFSEIMRLHAHRNSSAPKAVAARTGISSSRASW